MKNLLLSALATLALASCSGPSAPKFKAPVVVAKDNAPIRQNTMPDGRIIATASKGDTLEFDGMDSGGLCRVKPDARYGRFKSSDKAGYIARSYLAVSDTVKPRN